MKNKVLHTVDCHVLGKDIARQIFLKIDDSLTWCRFARVNKTTWRVGHTLLQEHSCEFNAAELFNSIHARMNFDDTFKNPELTTSIVGFRLPNTLKIHGIVDDQKGHRYFFDSGHLFKSHTYMRVSQGATRVIIICFYGSGTKRDDRTVYVFRQKTKSLKSYFHSSSVNGNTIEKRYRKNGAYKYITTCVQCGHFYNKRCHKYFFTKTHYKKNGQVAHTQKRHCFLKKKISLY